MSPGKEPEGERSGGAKPAEGDAMDFYKLADSPDLSQRFVEFAREREGPEVIDQVLELPPPSSKGETPRGMA